MESSRVAGKYDKAIDRHSAFEEISERRAKAEKDEATEKERKQKEKDSDKEKSKSGKKKETSFKKTAIGAMLISVLTSFLRKLSNELVKSLVGNKKK